MDKEKIILDLGCGIKKTPGAIGVECKKLPGVDIVHDLNVFPYPFESGTIDEIYILDVIDILEDVFKVMEECYRLLKPGGKVIITVVYWNHKYIWSDPLHRRGFNEISFDFFVKGRRLGREYYTDYKYSDIDIKYNYSGKLFKKLPSFFVRWLGKYLCNVIQGLTFTITK